MGYQQQPGVTAGTAAGGEYGDLAQTSAENTVNTVTSTSSTTSGYQQQPGMTGSIAAGGEYDNVDTATSIQYTNLAAEDAALAALSAAAAAASALAASNSADAAAISETNASDSADASAASAADASDSADVATTQAGIAATQAGIATTQANNAASSADTATTQAGIATTQAGIATTQAGNAASSASAASASAASAAASYDSFDDRYLGAKTADPIVDNDGNPLLTGALYFNSVTSLMKVYTGVTWVNTPGIATGGTAGQILSKVSSTNYDTQWITLTGTLNYQGAWNASTNTPTLTSSVGTNGFYYVVSVAGSTNLNGITDWLVGDWAIYNGSTWQKLDQTNTVTSVAGRTGAVTLTYTDIGGLGTAATTNSTDYATAAQGAKADTAIQTITSTDGSITVTPTGTTTDLSVAVAGATTNVICLVRNTTGATLTKGTAVYISGATGQNPTVSKALATSDATSAQTLGLMTADLANNSNGYVTIIGLITNINTSAYTDGQQLYLSGTTAGTLTATKPHAPIHLVYAAVVEHAHPTQGKLFVKVQNGYEMDELHDVSAQNPTNGQVLIYNETTSLWEKHTLTDGTGISIAEGAGSITITNSAPDQTVSLTGAGTTSISGTYPTFTITSNDQYVGTVTDVTGTAPINSTGGVTPAISLAANYGDTQNPYAAKTSNYVLAAPNGSSGVPTFRALVVDDIPTLNQNTTGTASNVTGIVALVNGGTGADNVATAQTNLQVDPAGTAVALAIALG